MPFVIDNRMLVSFVKVGVAVLIVVVWALVFVNAYVFDPAAPKPPAEFSAPMLAVVTWLFGTEIRKQLKKNGAANGGT